MAGALIQGFPGKKKELDTKFHYNLEYTNWFYSWLSPAIDANSKFTLMWQKISDMWQLGDQVLFL